MMLVSERVRDAFTSRVFHDYTNATVEGGGMGEVPCFGGMMPQNLHAEWCHWCGIK